ncbi:tyrosine-type recombinase/integrase [Microseira sp. BLCC-F43]|uniref:tyrosine-type recombinase/integrase n=1 Tax=Microseira sp. BLCC-F43 TaxID=3153602 RepID=UPI0035B73768
MESKPLPKPFTVDEVKAIINWFETSKYYKHADYVKCLFWKGTRTSEAIGLQWKHIDFNRNLLLLYESLGRNKNSTSKRVRKGTKTNKMR